MMSEKVKLIEFGIKFIMELQVLVSLMVFLRKSNQCTLTI